MARLLNLPSSANDESSGQTAQARGALRRLAQYGTESREFFSELTKHPRCLVVYGVMVILAIATNLMFGPLVSRVTLQNLVPMPSEDKAESMRHSLLIARYLGINLMARNCDDHTKNFGFILRQGQPWALAPAYDMTHAYNPKGEWAYQHLMSVNQKFKDISKGDLLAVADRFSVRKPGNALADVRAAIDNWSHFAKQAHLSPSLQNRVASDLLRPSPW